jgi:hypothetical protein
MTRYGFDQRNEGTYRLGCRLALAASVLMAGLALAGRRPEWMVPGPAPVAAFAVSGLVALIALRALPRAGYFRGAVMGTTVLAVGLAWLTSGGQPRLGGIMMFAGIGLILIPVLLGRASDRQTPEKTLRIPWPWR